MQLECNSWHSTIQFTQIVLLWMIGLNLQYLRKENEKGKVYCPTLYEVPRKTITNPIHTLNIPKYFSRFYGKLGERIVCKNTGVHKFLIINEFKNVFYIKLILIFYLKCVLYKVDIGILFILLTSKQFFVIHNFF
jgi:hypothetical protein